MNEIKSYYKMVPDYETYTPSNIFSHRCGAQHAEIIFEF